LLDGLRTEEARDGASIAYHVTSLESLTVGPALDRFVPVNPGACPPFTAIFKRKLVVVSAALSTTCHAVTAHSRIIAELLPFLFILQSDILARPLFSLIHDGEGRIILTGRNGENRLIQEYEKGTREGPW
jgi:hypothetical protein